MKRMPVFFLMLAWFDAYATDIDRCILEGVVSSDLRWKSINDGMKSASFDLQVSSVSAGENSGDLWCHDLVRSNSSNQGLVTVTVNNPSGNVDDVSKGKKAKVRWTIIEANEVTFAGFEVLEVSH